MKNLIARLAVSLVLLSAVPFIAYGILFSYCLVKDVTKTYRDSVTYDKVAEACYEVPESITPKGFCDYVAETQFPDMAGRCEGESEQVLKAFLKECLDLRNKNSDMIVRWDGA